MPTLSAVIVNYNADECVHRCIDSLLSNPPAGGVEVIVVDNASRDGSREKLARRDDVRFIANSRNTGYANACNIGAATAKGKYIMLLNPDVEVPRGGLDELIGFLRDTPDAGAAAPFLEGFDGRIQESYRRFPTLLYLAGSRRSPFYRVWPNNPISRRTFYKDLLLDRPRPVDFVCGGALVFPRRTLELTGGMDPRFFMYLEDADFCRRIALAGLRVYIVPGVRFKHRWSVSVAKHPFRMPLAHYISLGRYFAIHDRPRFIAYIAMVPILAVSLVLHWLIHALFPKKNDAGAVPA